MATLVTVRWRTPPPGSVDERLIVSDDGRARLDVLRPRSLGDTVGTYEGEIDEAEVRELTAAGPDVQVDVVLQSPRLAAVGMAADRVAQRLLASPLAVAQFFAVLSARSTAPTGAPSAFSVLARSRSNSSSISMSAWSTSPLRSTGVSYFLNCRWDS